MAGLLDRIRENWQKKDVWPPPHLLKHWDEIEGYRRRYRNTRAEMIQWNPNITVDQHKVEIFTPVPWPRELCRFSSALLFSEVPKVSKPGLDAEVESLVNINDFGSFAHRGGVKAAAEGRVGIRVIKDPEVGGDTPLLTLVNEDQVIWDIRHGSFYAGGMVVIERPDPDGDREVVFRLMEEHVTGYVRRFLYRGQRNRLGKQVPLATIREFHGLSPEEETGLDRPTLLPWENVPGGESDLFGLGAIFDGLNEAESLLLDRARKAIPRVFVDRSLADDTGRLMLDGYILTGGSRMRVPLGTSPASTIEIVEPKFLAKTHIEWIDHLTQLMVTCAGYSPLTWGIQGTTANVTRAVSGYAMKLSQLRTLLNRAGKEHMALQALGWGFGTALAWETGTHEVATMVPTIELGDGLPNDPLDGAQEVLFLQQAQAASTSTLVKTVHPTWSATEVEAEVERILEEGAFPPGGGPGTGIGPIPSVVQQMLTKSQKPKPTLTEGGVT